MKLEGRGTRVKVALRGIVAVTVLVAALTTVTPEVVGASTPPAAQDTGAFCANVPSGNRFADVTTGTHAGNIACLAWAQITHGADAFGGYYRPADVVTRGQMAAFVARALDRAYSLRLTDLNALAPADDVARFPDVGSAPPYDDGYRAGVNRLAAVGIVRGRPDGTFAPADPVTRAQMATFVNNAEDFLTGTRYASADDFFADDDGLVHEDNIDAVAGVGIVEGTAPATYAPDQPVSRAQMASVIVRWLAVENAQGRIGVLPPQKKGGTVTFVDRASRMYQFAPIGSWDQPVVTVTYAAGDSFMVDFQWVSFAEFDAALSVGDGITVSDYAAGPDVHDLLNHTPESYIFGTVGNVDISARTFVIVEPITGIVLSDVKHWDGGLFVVHGAAEPGTDEAAFVRAISEGDWIVITGSPPLFDLSDREVVGTVSSFDTVRGLLTIGSLGDDPTTAQDDSYNYLLDDAGDATVLRINGATVTRATFESALAIGAPITYSRASEALAVQTFSLGPP